jgi:PAS domain S-box-containing protein
MKKTGGKSPMKGLPNHQKIEDLKPGAHLCCIYETVEEHQKLLSNLLGQGLKRNEKVLYIVDLKNAEKTLSYLKNDGIKFNESLKENKLVVINALDANLFGNNFSPNKLLEFIKNESVKANSDGYPALRVTIDMSLITKVNHLKEFITYDTILNEFFPSPHCITICLYDIRWFEPKVLLDVFTTHPMVIVGNRIYDNHYYIRTNKRINKNQFNGYDDKQQENPNSYIYNNQIENDLFHLSNAIKMSMDSIIISNLEGKIIDVNNATIKMCEIDRKDRLVGKDLFSFLKPCSHEHSQIDIKNALNNGINNYHELNLFTHSGNQITVKTNIEIIKNGNGEPIGLIGIFRDITDKKVIEEKLEESEEKYRTLFNSSPEGIALIDLDGRLLDCNTFIERITGKKRVDLIGRPIMELNMFSDEDICRLIEIFPKTLTTQYINPIDMSIKFGKENGWVEVHPAIIKKNNQASAIQLIVRDITERKQTEEEMKKRLMKFILDDGKIYLMKETIHSKSIEAFKDLLKVGYQGLVVSRIPEKEFRKMINNNYFKFLWLAESEDDGTIPPKLFEIEEKIKNLFKTNQNKYAVLIGRIDYLIFKNGFRKTLAFVQRLRELVYLTGNIILISVDPGTLNNREQRLLELECKEVKPRLDKNILAEEQFKLLRIIYKCNIIGVRPSYTDIGHELGISKPTVRKRIRQLLSAGYVMEIIKGRNKVVELTQMGKNFFIK